MIQLLIPALTSLIDKLFPNQAEAEAAKLEMMKELNKAQALEIEAQAKVVVAEAQGESPAQRNWRPHLMYLFMTIIAFNYIIAPLLVMCGLPLVALPIPGDMWMMLTIGIGGYIGSRGYEKSVKLKNDKDVFEIIRSKKGYLTREDVAKINSIMLK